jgi:spore coat assembly protein
MAIEIDDIVVRKSHGKDVFFRVEAIDKKSSTALLRGLDIRLCADAPLEDLEKPAPAELAKQRSQSLRIRVEVVSKATRHRDFSRNTGMGGVNSQQYDELPGRVLHLDGDPEYMEICRRTYGELRVPAVTVAVPEEQQPLRISQLLREHKPDILVITGHDGLIKNKNPVNITSYRTSLYFVKAVEAARRYQSGKDDLVIFAGACQSHFAALMQAGANYASAPERVLIHCLDPVLVVEKLSYTPFLRQADLNDVISSTITGLPGIGGMETRGQFRRGLPPKKVKK